MLDEDNESETIDDTVINILLIYSYIDNLCTYLFLLKS